MRKIHPAIRLSSAKIIAAGAGLRPFGEKINAYGARRKIRQRGWGGVWGEAEIWQQFVVG
jgi:hypothetical protein